MSVSRVLQHIELHMQRALPASMPVGCIVAVMHHAEILALG